MYWRCRSPPPRTLTLPLTFINFCWFLVCFSFCQIFARCFRCKLLLDKACSACRLTFHLCTGWRWVKNCWLCVEGERERDSQQSARVVIVASNCVGAADVVVVVARFDWIAVCFKPPLWLFIIAHSQSTEKNNGNILMKIAAWLHLNSWAFRKSFLSISLSLTLPTHFGHFHNNCA